jgi:hypothetical protein
MSQRASGYTRTPDEAYETIAWPVAALLLQIGRPVGRVWDPCDRNSGRLVATLRSLGAKAVGTRKDFLATTKPPANISDLLTNPPYGERKRGEMAVAFIEHALELATAGLLPRIAMLLRNDFDSAIGRQHLFRNCPMFAGKVVLLNRIKWFAGPSSPSDNHSWFLWDRAHVGPAVIRYVTREEAELTQQKQKENAK